MERVYFAACTLGLEEVLAAELRDLGADPVEAGRGGVRFAGDARLAMKACLWLRSAIRVQEEIAPEEVHDERQLYDLVRGIEWEQFIGCDDTLAVDASLRDSFLTHSQFASRLVKDAVVDRFRDREGRRPDVDPDDPALPLRLHLARDVATIYADLSGESLHKRGYRDVQVKSPLNEAIAAGLLLASDWDRRSSVCDPMCGSATILIEAAWITGDRAPGLSRRFAFERWQDLDRSAWQELREEARLRAERGRAAMPVFLGADRHPGAVSIARRSTRAAGVAKEVQVAECDITRFTPSRPPTFVMTNPPYGERIGEGDDLERSWRALGDFLRRWPGLVAWVLSGNPETTRFMKLATSRKLPVRNGPIDCRLLRYEIDPLDADSTVARKKLPGREDGE